MAIINVPAPAGSEYAAQMMMQPWQQIGSAIGMGLGVRQRQKMLENDLTKLASYNQYLEQLRQAEALQQQAQQQGAAYQGPAPQWPAYQQLPVMRTPAFQQMQIEAMLGQALGGSEQAQRPFTLGPGQTRFDPAGRPIATVQQQPQPARKPLPDEVKSSIQKAFNTVSRASADEKADVAYGAYNILVSEYPEYANEIRRAVLHEVEQRGQMDLMQQVMQMMTGQGTLIK